MAHLSNDKIMEESIEMFTEGIIDRINDKSSSVIGSEFIGPIEIIKQEALEWVFIFSVA